MFRYISLTIAALLLLAINAFAEDIGGRLGVTGKLGAIVPLENSEVRGVPFSLDDSGFAAGGGLILGFNKHLAAEIDVSYVPSIDVKMSTGVVTGDASFTDIAVGLQYRFFPEKKLVPYLAVGGDFVKGEIENSSLEWAVGGHVRGGIDYFINAGIALNIDCKAVWAEKSDIKINGATVGRFDPTNVTTTVGFRLFIPKNWWM